MIRRCVFAALLYCGAVIGGEPAAIDGRVVDARTGEALRTRAIVQLASAPRATQRVFQKIETDADGRFHAQRLAPGRDPVMRIYAAGYRRQEWKRNAGGTLALRPLGEGPRALAAELAVWKRDIETDIASVPKAGRDAAVTAHEKLLLMLDGLCAPLAPRPARSCFGPDSPLGRFTAHARELRTKSVVVEEADSRRAYPVRAQSGGSRSQSAAQHEPTPGAGFSSVARP